MGKFERVYKASPLWLQNMMVSLYGAYWHWARFGGHYQTLKKGYQDRENYDRDDWNHYQAQELRKLLSICVNEVPYYQENWSEADKAAAIVGDLSALPLLEKGHLRQSPDRFHRQNDHPFPRFIFHTSGTTGTPIATTYTLSELRSTMALREVRSANWAGVSFTQPRGTFSGRMVEPDSEIPQAVYRFNSVEKQVYFSAFHINPANAISYVKALKKHRVVWLTGYTVSIFLLARFILEQNLVVPGLKAIITTSEKLSEEMRQVIEKAYHCPVFEEYSTVENALFASECDH